MQIKNYGSYLTLNEKTDVSVGRIDKQLGKCV